MAHTRGAMNLLHGQTKLTPKSGLSESVSGVHLQLGAKFGKAMPWCQCRGDTIGAINASDSSEIVYIDDGQAGVKFLLQSFPLIDFI